MSYRSDSRSYGGYGRKSFPQPPNEEIEHLMEGGYNMPTRILITSKKEVSNSVLQKKLDSRNKSCKNNTVNRLGVHNVRVKQLMRKR